MYFLTTDWIFASKIAGLGFLTVFIVLGILCLAVWVVGIIMYKTIGKNKTEANKPEEKK